MDAAVGRGHASLETLLPVVGVRARAVSPELVARLEYPRERVAHEHGLIATRTRVTMQQIANFDRFDHLLVSPSLRVP